MSEDNGELVAIIRHCCIHKTRAKYQDYRDLYVHLVEPPNQ